MQWNDSYAEDVNSPLSSDGEDIYENPEDLQDLLSPHTSDDLQYSTKILTNRRRKQKQRKKIKCSLIAFAIVVATLAVCVVAQSITLALLVERIDGQIIELNSQVVHQNISLSSILARQQDFLLKIMQEQFNLLYQKRPNCTSEERECSIDISGHAFTKYYWSHCNTDLVYINTTVSIIIVHPTAYRSFNCNRSFISHMHTITQALNSSVAINIIIIIQYNYLQVMYTYTADSFASRQQLHTEGNLARTRSGYDGSIQELYREVHVLQVLHIRPSYKRYFQPTSVEIF